MGYCCVEVESSSIVVNQTIRVEVNEVQPLSTVNNPVEGEDAALQAHVNQPYSHAGGGQDKCFLNDGLGDTFEDGMNKTVAIPPPLGLSFQQSHSGAMIITQVKPGSNAEATGQLHKGMKIVSVNKTPVESLGKKEVSNLIKSSAGDCLLEVVDPALRLSSGTKGTKKKKKKKASTKANKVKKPEVQ